MARRKVVVIGSGPAGYVAAIRASQLGAETVLVEKHKTGGVCLNSGCMPTKSLLSSARMLAAARNGAEYGLKIENVSPDTEAIRRRKDSAVSALGSGVDMLMKKNGVRVIAGRGMLSGDGRVSVETRGGKELLPAEAVIIATGSETAVPGVFGYDGEKVITSEEALGLREIPGSLLVAGAGAIGLEFACIYSAFGSRVTVVEMAGQIVPGEDAEAAGILAARLEASGIRIITGTRVESVSAEGGGVSALLDTGERLEAERCLVAVGRKPRAEGIEPGSVETDGRGFIKANERMETSAAGVFAAGDVTGGWLLAHKASAEGIIAAENACGMDSRMDYRAIPRCVYTLPEMASVGVSEERARENGAGVRVGKFPFAASGKARVEGDTEGMVKLVSDAGTGEILGVQIVGTDATELIAEAVLAVGLESLDEDLASTVHAHPTRSECLMEAAKAALGKAIHS